MVKNKHYLVVLLGFFVATLLIILIGKNPRYAPGFKYLWSGGRKEKINYLLYSIIYLRVYFMGMGEIYI